MLKKIHYYYIFTSNLTQEQHYNICIYLRYNVKLLYYTMLTY
jgi:hypothetical protein